MVIAGGVPNLTSKVINFTEQLENHIQYAIAYLQIPAFADVRSQSKIAFTSSYVAIQAIVSLLDLTMKPMLILSGLLLKFAYAILKVITGHSLQHGLVAVKEAGRHLYFGACWFIAFQKNLSRTAIMVELGIIVLLICLYSIRRYIQKKKYVERVIRWYNRKKRSVQMRIDRYVTKIAETSMTLYILLPHILYVSFIILTKYFLPSVVSYIATKTLTAEIISLYYPLFQTVKIIHNSRMYRNTSGNEKKRNDSDDASESVSEVVQLTTKLLQYWVVYSMLAAFYSIFSFLPIVGNIVSDTKWGKQLFFLNKLKISSNIMFEGKLFFFVWLCCLPSWLMIDNNANSTNGRGNYSMQRKNSDTAALSTVKKGSVKNKIKSFETMKKPTNKFTTVLKNVPSNQPLDILYIRLSPLAMYWVNSSSNLIQNDGSSAIGQKEKVQGVVTRIRDWCSSFLDIMVWTKLISKKTKEAIISFCVDCSPILPALPTMFMPGYFTRYGVVWSSLIVPSANSSNARDGLYNFATSSDGDQAMFQNRLNVAVRYLQYWILQFMISSILINISPVLAWVPLSTHITFIIWTFVQLERTTDKLYSMLEHELLVFQILPSAEYEAELDLSDSRTLQLCESLLKRLPSSRQIKSNEQTQLEEPIIEEPQQDKITDVSEEVKMNSSDEDSVEIVEMPNEKEKKQAVNVVNQSCSDDKE